MKGQFNELIKFVITTFTSSAQQLSILNNDIAAVKYLYALIVRCILVSKYL